MKRQLARILVTFFFTSSLLSAFNIELNSSYDYFRDMPDGSWNGNNGALFALNSDIPLSDCVSVQIGGSYGLYNWNGRNNVVFKDPQELQQIAFVTAGITSTCDCLKWGLVYDRLFTKHFSIYDLSPSFDQLRFKTGYSFCCDEFGVWGTFDLTRSHKTALGLPVNFKAIGQINLFWSHYFENSAEGMVWIGLPYRKSFMYPHAKAGNLIGGFSFRAPLMECLILEGNGSYMFARNSRDDIEPRNYHANICVGITYLFGGRCGKSPYMPVANHSNFFVDTNVNQ